jgi:hypothetical protein
MRYGFFNSRQAGSCKGLIPLAFLTVLQLYGNYSVTPATLCNFLKHSATGEHRCYLERLDLIKAAELIRM